MGNGETGLPADDAHPPPSVSEGNPGAPEGQDRGMGEQNRLEELVECFHRELRALAEQVRGEHELALVHLETSMRRVNMLLDTLARQVEILEGRRKLAGTSDVSPARGARQAPQEASQKKHGGQHVAALAQVQGPIASPPPPGTSPVSRG